LAGVVFAMYERMLHHVAASIYNVNSVRYLI